MNKMKLKKLASMQLIFILLLFVFMFASALALWTSKNLIADGQGSTYLYRQLLWYSIGFVLLFVILKAKMEQLTTFFQYFYSILLILLIYLLISRLTTSLMNFSLPFASPINGAYSWISFPMGFSFQPSEFMKIVLLIRTSQLIAQFKQDHPSPTIKDELALLIDIYVKSAPALILILLEPDTGVFLLIAATLFILYLCSGVHASIVYVTLGLIAAVVIGFFVLFFLYRNTLESIIPAYQLARIDAWLNPDLYSDQGAESSQLYTALLAIGSAGLFGYGFQADVIAIPEAHTDFIFASFGQSFGLLGTLFLVILCFVFDFFLLKMATETKNSFTRYLILATMIMLLYQQIQNIGMILGLFPITGITLPLLSYGGSSMLSYFLLFGLILNLYNSQSKVKFSFEMLSSKAKKTLSNLQRKNKNRTQLAQPAEKRN